MTESSRYGRCGPRDDGRGPNLLRKVRDPVPYPTNPWQTLSQEPSKLRISFCISSRLIPTDPFTPIPKGLNSQPPVADVVIAKLNSTSTDFVSSLFFSAVAAAFSASSSCWTRSFALG